MPIFTRDSDAYVKNPCVFTWFCQVMHLTLIFGLFFIGFLMYFHGEGSCKHPYSSRHPPVTPQSVLRPPGLKVDAPKAQNVPW